MVETTTAAKFKAVEITDVTDQPARGEIPNLVSQIKVGFESMVSALENHRDRLRDLEVEIRTLRGHCDKQCKLLAMGNLQGSSHKVVDQSGEG